MEQKEIIDTLSKLTLGDKLLINDWHAQYTVCGISQSYVLAHYGQHYTIIDKVPVSYTHNAVRKGDIRCAPDWWIFGYVDGYDFTNKDWVNKYMISLETGETELSQKRHTPVWFLAVVGHTNRVYRTKKETPEGA